MAYGWKIVDIELSKDSLIETPKDIKGVVVFWRKHTNGYEYYDTARFIYDKTYDNVSILHCRIKVLSINEMLALKEMVKREVLANEEIEETSSVNISCI